MNAGPVSKLDHRYRYNLKDESASSTCGCTYSLLTKSHVKPSTLNSLGPLAEECNHQGSKWYLSQDGGLANEPHWCFSFEPMETDRLQRHGAASRATRNHQETEIRKSAGKAHYLDPPSTLYWTLNSPYLGPYTLFEGTRTVLVLGPNLTQCLNSPKHCVRFGPSTRTLLVPSNRGIWSPKRGT